MYSLKTTKQFEKDVRLCEKRGLDLSKLYKVMTLLTAEGRLPKEYKPHKLKENFAGKWECHVSPDWLLIYEKKEEIRLIKLIRTGTHSELFGK